MMTRTWTWIATASLIAATATVTGCGADVEASSAAPPSADPATPVRTTQVQWETRTRPVSTTGTLSSKAEVSLAFKIGGFVDRILAEEGDRVREGQVLARLQMEEADAGVTQARIETDQAARALARMERLYADTVVTLAQLEEAQDRLNQATAALDVAAFNRRYAEIVAPEDGRVLRRFVDEAEWIGAGASAFLYGSGVQGWVVRVSLPDYQVVRIEPGTPATVEFDALDGAAFPGSVIEVAQAADPGAGTFEVEVELAEIDPRLRSGFVGRVTLEPSEAQASVHLPHEALVDADGRDASVFVLEGTTVRAVPVRVLHLSAETVAVDASLAEGVTVVTTGAAFLRDGMQVLPIDYPSSATAQGR